MTDNTRALLEQALGALEAAYSTEYDGAKIHSAKLALRAELAKPVEKEDPLDWPLPCDIKTGKVPPPDVQPTQKTRYWWRSTLVRAGLLEDGSGEAKPQNAGGKPRE